jgi:hypothetical protein
MPEEVSDSSVHDQSEQYSIYQKHVQELELASRRSLEILQSLETLRQSKQWEERDNQAERELVTSSQTTRQGSFGRRGDRMIAMTAGGAFIGGTIAQAPGAIIGATAGAVFALFAKVDEFS